MQIEYDEFLKSTINDEKHTNKDVVLQRKLHSLLGDGCDSAILEILEKNKHLLSMLAQPLGPIGRNLKKLASNAAQTPLAAALRLRRIELSKRLLLLGSNPLQPMTEEGTETAATYIICNGLTVLLDVLKNITLLTELRYEYPQNNGVVITGNVDFLPQALYNKDYDFIKQVLSPVINTPMEQLAQIRRRNFESCNSKSPLLIAYQMDQVNILRLVLDTPGFDVNAPVTETGEHIYSYVLRERALSITGRRASTFLCQHLLPRYTLKHANLYRDALKVEAVELLQHLIKNKYPVDDGLDPIDYYVNVRFGINIDIVMLLTCTGVRFTFAHVAGIRRSMSCPLSMRRSLCPLYLFQGFSSLQITMKLQEWRQKIETVYRQIMEMAFILATKKTKHLQDASVEIIDLIALSIFGNDHVAAWIDSDQITECLRPPFTAIW